MSQAEIDPDEAQSRRFFLGGLFAFLASIGLIVVGALRFVVPNVTYGKPLRFKVGHPQDFPDKAATYVADQKVFVVRDGNTYMALSATCTHLGCTVRTDPDKPGFFCPCHGSRYTPDGTNYAGPAPRPLDTYEVSMGGTGDLIVDKRSPGSRKDRFRA